MRRFARTRACGLVTCRAVRALLLFVAASAPAYAQGPGAIEIGHGEARLTHSYPAWSNSYARASLPIGGATYAVELVHRRAFDDDGVFAGASATQAFGSAWYGMASVGGSAGGFFFPRATFGGMLARKWLSRRQLVTTSALTYFAQKDVHRDLLWTPSVVYYFARPAVIEAGVNVAHSSPGAVVSASPFVAARVGDPLRRTVSARVSAGREAYTRLGADTALVAFNSHVVSVAWRERVLPAGGFVLEAERYANVAYARTGISLGVFASLGR